MANVKVKVKKINAKVVKSTAQNNPKIKKAVKTSIITDKILDCGTF